MKVKKIALVIPTLTAGGMERVISLIANYFSQKENIEVHLILLLKREIHYGINPKVKIYQPTPKEFNRFGIFKQIKYLRKLIKVICPDVLISFGSMYNSFVMISCIGLEKKVRIFLSDRSNPYRNTYFSFKKNPDERHDGFMHFILKRILYRRAYGILAQTKLSVEIEKRTLKHKNIIYFPNPVKINNRYVVEKENIILNVGRFVNSKQQIHIVRIFSKINNPEWFLYLIGDGPEKSDIERYVVDNKVGNVVFLGNVKDVNEIYRKAKIFAFTSRSEGFPNVLAEAMATPLACISYNCIAGPSDLIKDNYNGFLIDQDNEDMFQKKLKILMNNLQIREKFMCNSRKTILEFEEGKVLNNLFNEILK